MSKVVAMHPYQLLGRLDVISDKLIARGHYLQDQVLVQWGSVIKHVHDDMMKAQGEQDRALARVENTLLELQLEMSVRLMHETKEETHSNAG